MRFLDTQILIWALEDNSQLKVHLRRIIEDNDHEILVSQFSLMEIAIKLKLGKLPAFVATMEAFVEQITTSGFTVLPGAIQHIIAYQRLAFFDDHRDPFDRFLLATALSENIPIISADAKFLRYPPVVEVIN